MCDVVFDFISPHNGEYWYKCNECGATEWFARYDTIERNTQLRGCKMVKDDVCNVKVHNTEQFTTHDVSVEKWREYHYEGGVFFRIEEPNTLFLKRDNNGDSHRIVDKKGVTWYPKRGWLSISWYAPSENVSF